MKQDMYDVVETLIRDKDEAIEATAIIVQPFLCKAEFFEGPFLIAYQEEFRAQVISALRRFVRTKLDIPYDDIMAYIDDELFDTYPELEFYLEQDTYGNESQIH